MCNNEEWEKLRRRFERAVESEDLEDFVHELATRVEALIDEIKVCACPADDAEWGRRRRRQSRPQWVV